MSVVSFMVGIVLIAICFGLMVWASKQLSFIYGHIPFFIWSRTEAMDSSFWDYVRFLDHSKMRKQ
jgi:hypothetical protein